MYIHSVFLYKYLLAVAVMAIDFLLSYSMILSVVRMICEYIWSGYWIEVVLVFKGNAGWAFTIHWSIINVSRCHSWCNVPRESGWFSLFLCFSLVYCLQKLLFLTSAKANIGSVWLFCRRSRMATANGIAWYFRTEKVLTSHLVLCS